MATSNALHLIAAADKGKGSEEAADYLIQHSTSENLDLVLLLPQHLPRLVANHPSLWKSAIDAAYDVSENENKLVRIAGYRMVVSLAEISHGEEAGTMTDVLVQMLSSSYADGSRDEIETLEDCIKDLIRLNADASIGLLTSLLIRDTNITSDLVWKILEGPAQADVARFLQREDDGNVQNSVKDSLYQLLEIGDRTSRLKAIGLLLQMPEISGKSASRASSTSFLAQIVLCAKEEPAEAEAIIPYLEKIDTLLIHTKPDYRWILYLYCHSPGLIFQWAKLAEGTVPIATISPSRLVEWIVTSWGLWREENMAGHADGVDERLGIRELGLRIARTAVAQVPKWFQGNITLITTMPLIAELEVCLLLSYFLFLKFKGQVENLTDGGLRKTLTAIAGVCEKGLANSYASSEVTRAKWANVQKMCQNMLPPIKLETVHPSWTLTKTIATPNSLQGVPAKLPESVPTSPAVQALSSGGNVSSRRSPSILARTPATSLPGTPVLPHATLPSMTIKTNKATSPGLSIRDAANRNSPSHLPNMQQNEKQFSIRSASSTSQLSGPSSRPSLLGRISIAGSDSGTERKRPRSPLTSGLKVESPDSDPSSSRRSASLASRLGIAVPEGPSQVNNKRRMDAQHEPASKRKRNNGQSQLYPNQQAEPGMGLSPASTQIESQEPGRPLPKLLARMQIPQVVDQQQPSSQPLVINNLARHTPAPAPAPAPAPLVLLNSQPNFSIRNQSAIAPPPVIIPANVAPIPVPSPSDDGIIRRGRGFANAGIEIPSPTPTRPASPVVRPPNPLVPRREISIRGRHPRS